MRGESAVGYKLTQEWFSERTRAQTPMTNERVPVKFALRIKTTLKCGMQLFLQIRNLLLHEFNRGRKPDKWPSFIQSPSQKRNGPRRNCAGGVSAQLSQPCGSTRSIGDCPSRTLVAANKPGSLDNMLNNSGLSMKPRAISLGGEKARVLTKRKFGTPG